MIIKFAKNNLNEWDIRSQFGDENLMSGRPKEITDKKMDWIIEKIEKDMPFTIKDTILDIGPGNGVLLKKISNKVMKCYGIDPSKMATERLRILCNDYPNIHIIQSFSFSLNFPDGFFDKVIMNSVIHYLHNDEEVERTISEIARVTRAGGLVYFGEVPSLGENLPSLWQYRKRIVKRIINTLHQSTRRHSFLENIIKDDGVEIIQTREIKKLRYDPEKFMDMVNKYGLYGKVLEDVVFIHARTGEFREDKWKNRFLYVLRRK